MATTDTQPHRSSRRLSKPQAQELVNAYRAGSTILQLAGQYRVNRNTVMAHLRRAGVPRYSGWTAETTAEARQLYESGLSIAAIAEEMGRAKTTIGDHLRAAGVQMRPKGWQ